MVVANRYENSQAVRHHADNVTILSFDKKELEQRSIGATWIHGEQYDDEGDDHIPIPVAGRWRPDPLYFPTWMKRELCF